MQNYQLAKERLVSDTALLFLSQRSPADAETLLCRLQTQHGLTEEEKLSLKSLAENRQRCP
jgi:hypothetical protein